MHAKLKQLREERANGDHGFTLIELLVVVVIIGILVAIAIPLYLNYRKGAENKSAESDVRNAVSTVESCMGDNAGTPPVGTVTSDKGGSIYLTCKADGTGAASKTATGANQTINVSSGDVLTYTPSATTYTIVGNHDGDNKWYKYDSSTGKTVESDTAPTG